MPGYGRRFWAERTPAARRGRFPRFTGRRDVDAVVVGGGLTGSCSAYVLARAGLKVVVLEAGRVAEGATAGSPGVIVPEPDAAFRDAEMAAGRRAARTVWAHARRGATELAGALRKLSIRCDLAPAPFIINAPGPEDALALRKEQRARRDAGVTASWLAAPAVQAEIGTDTAGALHRRDAFAIDPVRATLGLLAAAVDEGAEVFEQSEVRRTRFTRKYAEAVLPGGVLRTRLIVVATGEPGPIVGQLRRHVRRRDGYVVVTEPLDAARRRESGRRRAVVTEAGAAPHWWRHLPDNRVLFAGAVAAPAGPRQRDRILVQRAGQLMYELSVRYPVFSGIRAEWAWNLPVVSTADTLPWIGPHRNFPFHFLALGFGWHGDGLAWAAARAALRFARGEARTEDRALGFARHL